MTGRSVTPEHTMARELWLCTKLLLEHGVFSPEYVMALLLQCSGDCIKLAHHGKGALLLLLHLHQCNDVCTLPVYETCIELWLSSVAWLVLVLFLTKPIVMLVQHP